MAYYIASYSGGNDSNCMTNLLIDKGYPLDEIVFYDTGAEFNAIYKLWEQIKAKAEPLGIKCTKIEPKEKFFYKMFDKLVQNRDKSGFHFGYSWCGGRCRWGTTEKLKALDGYCESKNATVYVGIAYDEQHRTPDKSYKIHPLKDWEMTQADCLKWNRENGVKWLEKSPKTESGYIDLYDILDRVSCWCCANKNQWELYNIWFYLPHYWEKLCELQRKNERPFKSAYGIFDIQKRFENGYVPKHRK